MCFSAEASFTAAVGLAIVGTIFLKKFKGTKKIFLAFIPIFFALQQASEGFVWVALNHNLYPNTWSLIAQYIFLFFAYMFWPVWIPFACMYAEKPSWKKYLIAMSMLGGFMILLFSGYVMVQEGARAHIVGQSISYGESSQAYRLIYALFTCSPLFISSIPNAKLFGILSIASFIVVDVAYTFAFVSVWCFVAAVLSIAALIAFHKDQGQELDSV